MDAKRVEDYGKNNNRPGFATMETTRLFDAIQQAQMRFNVFGSRVLPRQVSSGTYAGTQQVGGSNVNISGANKNITMNDGTNDRLLIGYQQGGF